MSMAPDRHRPKTNREIGAEYGLASYGHRMGAYIIDNLMFTVPLVAILWASGVGLLGRSVAQFETGGFTIRRVPIGVLGGYSDTVLLGVQILSAIVCVVYVAWWLVTIKRGQTPGKQVVGIRVIRKSGEPSGRAYTFVREFVVKGLLLGLLVGATGGVVILVNYLWPLWDSERQALHDKLMSTLVVRINGA